MRLSRWCRFILLVALCFCAFSNLRADTVPWLTGSASTNYGVVFLGSGNVQFPPGDFGPDPFSLTFGSSGNYTFDLNCDGRWCSFLGQANLAGGYVSMDEDQYQFSGRITSGSSELWGLFLEADGCPDLLYCVDTESEVFAFVGFWNNSWATTGRFDDWFTYYNFNAYYDLEMVTTTPEPGTLFLFGSSVLGVMGVLRRRL
jgi:PEP-CTERM motif-containing protein